jgi:hypothetical protein
MSTKMPSRPSRPASGASRTRTLILGLITLLAILACVAFINVLASRFAQRLDMTATRDMALAPRTAKLLTTMEGEHRLIIATDLRSADPRAVQHLKDLLEEVDAATARSASRFRSTLIDTSSPSGVRDFESLIADLVRRDREPLGAAHAATVRDIEASDKLARSLETDVMLAWSSLRTASADASPSTRAFVDQGATLLSVRSRELRDAVTRASGLIAPTQVQGDTFIAPTDDAAKLLVAKLLPAANDLAALSPQLRRLLQDPSSTPEAARAAQSLIANLDAWSTSAQQLLQHIRGSPQPEVARLANALKAGKAAVLLGPAGKGLVAIDLDQLLPSALWINAAQASQTDLKRRVEELLATALTSLRVTLRPIVVVVHAEQRPFLNESPVIDALRQRLSMRGVDMLEWAIITSPAPPPDFSTLDPQRARPVVYATLAPDSAAARPVQGGLSGAERATKLGETLRALFEQDANVLVSLNPSVLPTYGEKDPLAAALLVRGVEALTGTPLLSQVITKQGAYAETDRVVQAMSLENTDSHPLLESVRGLPTYLTWCIPLRASKDESGWKTAPVYRVVSDAATWGEGQWLQLRQTPREARSLMPQQPVFDEGRDQRLASGASWSVALTSEGTGARLPRLVVVGSNDWFIDAVTQQATSIDGRSTLAFPGNLEFFESCVWWLAHQDELIAQSATARAVPIVKPITPSSLRQVRLALIIGLPAVVLLLGALYRVIRGG